MFSLKGVVIGIGVAMLLALAAETAYIHHQTKANATTVEVNKELSARVATASSVIAQQAEEAKVTNLVVTQTTDKILKTQAKKLPLIQKVDDTARQLKDEKISSTAADAAYTDSMWAAYCTSGIPDSHCKASAGQPAH